MYRTLMLLPYVLMLFGLIGSNAILIISDLDKPNIVVFLFDALSVLGLVLIPCCTRLASASLNKKVIGKLLSVTGA